MGLKGLMATHIAYILYLKWRKEWAKLVEGQCKQVTNMRQFTQLKKISKKIHYYFYVSKSLSVSVRLFIRRLYFQDNLL